MKSLRKSQNGTSLVAILMALMVIAVIGVVAYRVRSNTLTGSGSGQAAVVAAPKTVKSKADLNTAKHALQTAPIGSDLDSSQLDDSINSLL